MVALKAQHWPRATSEAPQIGEIVFINLDTSTERREYMERELKALRSEAAAEGNDFRISRLSAVTKDEARQDERWASWRDRGFNHVSYPHVVEDWGVAACAMSHYEALRRYVAEKREQLERDHEVVLIAEDDVVFDPDFWRQWASNWPFVPESWDVLKVGGFNVHTSGPEAINDHLHLVNWSDPAPYGPCMDCGNQAYVVRPGSAQKVLNRYEVSMIFHADSIVSAPTPPTEDPDSVPVLQAFFELPLMARPALNEDGMEKFASDRER